MALGPNRASVSITIETDLLERARATAYWTRRSLAGLFVAGLAAELDRLEAAENEREPWPPAPGVLPTGRPGTRGER